MRFRIKRGAILRAVSQMRSCKIYAQMSLGSKHIWFWYNKSKTQQDCWSTNKNT